MVYRYIIIRILHSIFGIPLCWALEPECEILMFLWSIWAPKMFRDLQRMPKIMDSIILPVLSISGDLAIIWALFEVQVP